MPAVGESALECVGLDRDRSRGHEPRSVRELISQQPLHATPVGRIFRGKVSGDMQGVKRFACRVSFARNAGKLAPTSVGVLGRLQRSHERRAFRGTGARVGQCVELHGSFFLRGSPGGEQPAFGAGDALLEFLATAGDRIQLDRAQDHRGGGERSVLFRRPVAGGAPRAVRQLVIRKVVNMRVRQCIGTVALDLASFTMTHQLRNVVSAIFRALELVSPDFATRFGHNLQKGKINKNSSTET